jgi:hypothetical protein
MGAIISEESAAFNFEEYERSKLLLSGTSIPSPIHTTSHPGRS